jgi:arylsulfatase A
MRLRLPRCLRPKAMQQHVSGSGTWVIRVHFYLPHAMTHNPLHASETFRGKSANGIYGDAVEEIDWSTGEILKLLQELGLSDNTLVVFTSDNGAAPNWGGSNGILSGWKGSTWEGGMREPCLMWWPGTVPAGQTCSELATTMDLLPTICEITGAELPAERIIDGKNILPLMMAEDDAVSPHDAFYYYQLEQLQAVRSGKWKLHLALDSMYTNIHRGTWGAGREMKLFDLSRDIREEIDVSADHPDVVEKLLQYVEHAREDLGDLGREGINVRKAAIVEDPVPQLLISEDMTIEEAIRRTW